MGGGWLARFGSLNYVIIELERREEEEKNEGRQARLATIVYRSRSRCSVVGL